MNRENDFRHYSYDTEMLQYEYIKNADPRWFETCRTIFHSDQTGHLSDNPVRNLQYLFICFITMVTRFCVEGGLEMETAYNVSDLFIQKADHCHTMEEVYALHEESLQYYYEIMSSIVREKNYSKPIVKCIDYIYDHLHETIHLNELAKYISLNASYLSVLFHRETGKTITDYILAKKIEAAKNMLRYSDYSQTEISNFLAFSSNSHFITTFKKYAGMTPKQYQEKNFRINF